MNSSPPVFRPITEGPLAWAPQQLALYGEEVFAINDEALWWVRSGQSTLIDEINEVQGGGYLHAVDLYGDSSPELVVSGRQFVVVWQRAGSEYQRAWSAALPDSHLGQGAVVVGDLNHDGHRDLIARGGDSILWYRGDGEGGFDSQQASNSGLEGLQVAALLLFVADIDADGDSDVVGVYAYRSWGPDDDHDTFLGVHLNLGDTSSFETAQRLSLRSTGYVPVIDRLVDLSGDGRPDFAWVAVSDTGSVADRWWLSQGEPDGMFGEAKRLEVPAVTVGGDLLTADVDGNGTTDFLVPSTNSVALMNEEDGGVDKLSLPVNLGTPSIVAVADGDAGARVVAALRIGSWSGVDCDDDSACTCLFGMCAQCLTGDDCEDGECVASECVGAAEQ